jgi:hypothetical protein
VETLALLGIEYDPVVFLDLDPEFPSFSLRRNNSVGDIVLVPYVMAELAKLLMQALSLPYILSHESASQLRSILCDLLVRVASGRRSALSSELSAALV